MDAIGLSLSAEETLARTIHCTECNAPPNLPCQRINWENQLHPHCVPRRYHGERLRDARRVARIREKKNAGDSDFGFMRGSTASAMPSAMARS